jgi:hypothetical protein
VCDFNNEWDRIRKENKEAGPQAQSAGFIRVHGKGSHGRLWYGGRFTTLKDRKKEIGPSLLSAMLDQLGLTREDLTKEDPEQ